MPGMHCRVPAVLLAATLALPAWGQELGQWHAGLSFSYSLPVSSLGKWFLPAPNLDIAIGQRITEQWTVAGGVELARYDREALSGYAAGKLTLLLEHVAALVVGEFQLTDHGQVFPFLLLSGGVYRWKGVRGAVPADSSVTPYLPAIAERRLCATNWGMRLGFGLKTRAWHRLALEGRVWYRLVLGDLWPTMQPHIELEGVSGFQTMNASVGVRYFF
ncbi:MAG: hypothetical protein H5U38_05480 [Calditrichaeota bacterium]|nr:hypothetical protein [Calditrichota bacterium]